MVDDKTKQEIKALYQAGKGSIQDYARIYRLTVDEVLQIVGEEGLREIRIGGDMIDPSEAGPGAQMNYGRTEQQNFSTN